MKGIFMSDISDIKGIIVNAKSREVACNFVDSQTQNAHPIGIPQL